MIKIMLLITILSTLAFPQTAELKEDDWMLIGAVDDINFVNSLSGSCFVFAYNAQSGKWNKYNSDIQDLTSIEKGKGFWLTSKNTCTFNTDSNPNVDTRFISKTIQNNTLLYDSANKIEWVNGSPGCKPTLINSQSEAFNTSKEYCANLSFASFTDWRLPTVKEAQEFIVETEKANILPYYESKGCPRLIGYNGDKTKVQTATTHNLQPSGSINDWTGGNAGIRCVRDVY